MPALLRNGFLAVWFVFIAIPGSGQTDLPRSEARISQLFARLQTGTDPVFRQSLADSIQAAVKEALLLPGSFAYPFQAVKMGKVTSSDEKVRFYTWNIPYMDGHSDFYGVIQYKPDNKSLTLIELRDNARDLPNPETLTLAPDQWYGMLVYDIIVKKTGSQTLYTLLCFANEDLFLSKKAVDVLFFDDAGKAWFGKPVFRIRGKLQSRLLFRYSSKVRMSLNWDEHSDRIIFDHLSPSKPSLTGNYSYYGPDLSFDALHFNNGIWELTEDVDARNPESGN